MKQSSFVILTVLGALLVASGASASTLSGKNTFIYGTGNTGTMDITVSDIPAGLAGYNLTVSLSDPSVAEIVAVTFPSWSNQAIAGWPHQNANGALPADAAWLKAADVNRVVPAGATNVVLATLTIRGDAPGASFVNITLRQMSDDSGTNMLPVIVNRSVVVNPPDIVMKLFDAPDSVGQGQVITLTNTVWNTGTGSTGRPFSVNFYLSVNGKKNTVFIGSRTVPALAANATHTNGTTLAIPPKVTPGSYYVRAVADLANEVVESNDANNAKFDKTPTTVTGRPDITLAAVDAPASGVINGSISIVSTVANTGAVAIPVSTKVRFYLSADTVLDGTDRAVMTYKIPLLAAGASKTVTKAGLIPATVTPGSYYAIGRADFKNLVAEQSETNNVLLDPVPVAVTA